MRKISISSSQEFQGAILAVLGIFLFSAKAVMVKYIYMGHDIDAVSLLLLRMVFSLPVYLIVLIYHRKKIRESTGKKDYMYILFLGFIGYYLASYFDFEGLKFITASLERLILFIYPTLVLLISALVFRIKISHSQWIAIIITYLGILVTFTPSLGENPQQNIWLGSFLIFLSALTYASYIVGSGKIIPKIGSVRFTALAMTVSCLAVILHQLMVNQVIWPIVDTEIYFWGFCMAMFSTVIPSFLVSEAIKKIGSSNFAIIGSLGPVSTILLAVIFINEMIDVYQIAGTILVIVGVMSLKGRRKEKAVSK